MMLKFNVSSFFFSLSLFISFQARLGLGRNRKHLREDKLNPLYKTCLLILHVVDLA